MKPTSEELLKDAIRELDYLIKQAAYIPVSSEFVLPIIEGAERVKALLVFVRSLEEILDDSRNKRKA